MAELPKVKKTVHVEKDQDYRTVAESSGMWDWWDLVLFNQHLSNQDISLHEPVKATKEAGPQPLKTPDLLPPKAEIKVPDVDAIVARGKALLAEEAQGNVDQYFNGEGYLSVWGAISVTLHDEQQQARYPQGTPFRFLDLDGDVITFLDLSNDTYKTEGTLNDKGGFAVDLPRTSYFLEVKPGDTWIRAISLDESAFAARRAERKLPGKFSAELSRRLLEGGLDAIFEGR